MGQRTITTCDRCGHDLTKIIVHLKTPITNGKTGVTLLKEGDYCSDCVAKACGHECPVSSSDGDP